MMNTKTLPEAPDQALNRLDNPPKGLLTGASLFLDFDGTLVELAERPDGVAVAPGLAPLLGRWADRLEGRLALVSGRGLADLDGLIGDLPFPVAGSHGAEIRLGDRLLAPPRSAALDEALAALSAFAADHPGVLVEDKPLGVALHYRMAPEAAQACHALAGDLAMRLDLHLQTGKMMVELRPAGADKGTAVRRLMQEMPGTRPVFIGDDDTDEPAFRVAAELGGAGILVGPPRDTAAHYRLSGVAAVHAWLAGEVAL